MTCRSSLLISLWLLLFLTACQTPPVPQWRWERAEAGLPRQSITLAVAAHPTDANHLWVGSYTPGGLTRSEDGGQTWMQVEVGQADNPVFDLLFLPPPLLSPPLRGEAEGVLWAATRVGLLYSADDGLTWQRTSDGLPAMPILSLAADAGGRIYAGLDSAGIYAQTTTGGWESLAAPVIAPGKTGGLSPTPVETDAENELLASAGVLSLAVSPDGQYIYAGTSGRGIFASQDGGQSWVNTYMGTYGPNLALNPTNPQVAVAGLRDRLVRTHDGGQTWHTLPVAWAQELIVSLLWRADGVLGVGTGQGRLYYSRDEGDTWLESSTGLPKGAGILDLAITSKGLLAATWTGLYGSDDGESWQYLTPALGQPNATSLLTAESGLWLGTRTGLFRWQAESRRWQAVPAEFPSGGIASLAAGSANSQILYAGSSGDGLYGSDDDGARWQRLPTLGVGVPAVAVDPNDSDRIYHLAAWERVYETRNGGQLWQARWTGMGDTTEAVSIAVDPSKPYVYAGSDTGLYRSYDGRAWRLVAPTLADQTILALLAQPAPPGTMGNSVLYIGTTRGVYRSLTSGATVQGGGEEAKRRRGEIWGRGLENISVTALLTASDDSSRLYAGTAYQGVYQSIDWGYTWQPIGPADLTDDVVEDMAWGPAGELFIVAPSGVWVGAKE